MVYSHLLLTGGTGFLGSAILRRLQADHSFIDRITVLSRHPHVSADPRDRFLKADLTDASGLRSIAGSIGAVDVLVDAATLMPYGQRPRSDWDSLVRVNLGGVANLLSHLVSPPGWVVYISSTDIYGESEGQVITDKTPPNPQSDYAVTKLFAEYMYARYCKVHGIPLTILRICSIYGPGDPSPKVINTFVRSALKGRPLELHGDGQDLRDFIFIDDASRIVVEVLHNRLVGTYNLATGRSHRVLDVVQILQNLIGKPLEIVHLPRRGDRKDLLFAPSSLVSFGVSPPEVSLKEGISMLVDHLQKSSGIT